MPRLSKAELACQVVEPQALKGLCFSQKSTVEPTKKMITHFTPRE